MIVLDSDLIFIFLDEITEVSDKEDSDEEVDNEKIDYVFESVDSGKDPIYVDENRRNRNKTRIILTASGRFLVCSNVLPPVCLQYCLTNLLPLHFKPYVILNLLPALYRTLFH